MYEDLSKDWVSVGLHSVGESRPETMDSIEDCRDEIPAREVVQRAGSVRERDRMLDEVILEAPSMGVTRDRVVGGQRGRDIMVGEEKERGNVEWTRATARKAVIARGGESMGDRESLMNR